MQKKINYCHYCNSNRVYCIDSLKHSWIFCLDCKNSKSFAKKNKTIFNYISYILLIIDKVFRVNLVRLLCYYDKSPQDSYFYYSSIIKKCKYQNTKWFNYDKNLINFLKKNNIDLKKKKLISISEEPGFFYNKIKEQCSDIVFTALNKSVANDMKQFIGVNTLTYDANKDDISKLINKKFDIILLRGLINHIEDLKKFIVQIKKIMHKNTIVICGFNTPSIHTSIVYGYDDFTFNTLYDDKFLENQFLKKNFKIKKKITQTEDVKKHYSKFKKILFTPMYYFFRLKNFIKNKNFEKITKNQLYLKRVILIMSRF
jgi:hypothetical protein